MTRNPRVVCVREDYQVQQFKLDATTPWYIAQLYSNSHTRPALEAMIRHFLFKSRGGLGCTTVVLFDNAVGKQAHLIKEQPLPRQLEQAKRVFRRMLSLPRTTALPEGMYGILNSPEIKKQSWEIADKILGEMVDRKLDPVAQDPYIENVLLYILSALFPKTLLWVVDIDAVPQVGIQYGMRAVVNA